MGRRSTRVAVISDLHLGGDPPGMCSRPERLVRFLDRLPTQLAGDEDLRLVIAGDFVDFLAIRPWEPFTADPRAAVEKLRGTMAGPFAPVFDALARLAAGGHRITVLIGNHDLELALPPVQDALLARLGAPDRLDFLADGRALRIGGALVEHGNRYEAVNANDFTGLRAVASALSRGEEPDVELRPSPGSEVVAKVLNVIERRYPFLEPDGLAAYFERGEPVPAKRLRQIRLLARRLLLDDRSSRPDGPAGPWGEAAARILAANRGALATVVMGHTHQARHLGPAERAGYINTGTWAGVIRVPVALLAEGADGAFEAFLHDLWRDVRPEVPATWADLRIEADGAVTAARLRQEG